LPRRSWYYRSVKAAPKVQEHLVTPIKVMIEKNPSFGYRTVAALLGFNKNTVQRIFQLKGGKSASARSGFAHGSRPCHRWRLPQTSVGRPTYAGSGLDRMAGVRWPW
jgi:hypothetical protein